MATIKVSEDGSALTVLVPMSVRSSGGPKLVLSPLRDFHRVKHRQQRLFFSAHPLH
jgi:hypothetical protein